MEGRANKLVLGTDGRLGLLCGWALPKETGCPLLPALQEGVKKRRLVLAEWRDPL